MQAVRILLTTAQNNSLSIIFESRGFFTIDRRVVNHPLVCSQKFSEREAWFWLISSAAWAEITSSALASP